VAKPPLRINSSPSFQAARTMASRGGYFYGRGTADMKAQAATRVDTMIRLKQEGFRHRRAIKMALTCGEETAAASTVPVISPPMSDSWLTRNVR
jgi:acetylornithine deacetylase/succinyl-diaminopimelate desuccinylase-like protein